MPEIKKPKPCPWCGGEARTQELHGGGIWDIECSSTNTEACPGYAFVIGGSEEEVIENWNRRAGEAALAKRIEELEAVFDRVKEDGEWFNAWKANRGGS
jgi:hypothetical protein